MVSFRSRGVGAHLDRQHALGDQLARAGPDDAHAQHALGLRVDRSAWSGRRCGRASSRGPTRPTGTARPRPSRPSLCACGSVRPHQASSGIGEDHRRDRARLEGRRSSPAIASTATRPSCVALCASIGSPATSPIAKIVGSAVRRCASTLMKPRRSTCDAGLFEARDRSSSAGGRRRPARGRTACSRLRRRPSPSKRHADPVCPSSFMSTDLGVEQDGLESAVEALGEDVDEVAVGAGQQARQSSRRP